MFFLHVIALAMQRIKRMIAMLLALVWLPAVSCCLIDTSGLLDQKDCCSKKHTHTAASGDCDKPCGLLASATYLSQQDQVVVVASIDLLLFEVASSLIKLHRQDGFGRELPATAPPELAGNWQFSFRTALSPRAPSFVS